MCPDVPAPTTAELDLVRAAVATDYELVAEIGRGGMAVVYRAVERELERDVALKVLPLSMINDASTVERFLREARMAARLDHPHVVPIWRVGRAGGFPFIAMKLVQGPTLGELLATRGVLPAAMVRRLLIETASALAHAHAHGIVHRDVKPDNILLEPDGRALVTDFGIARAVREGRLTASGTAIGTPRYMSPEQARAKAVDGRADLYSLGIVAYECLAGRVPFDGEDPVAILLAHVEEPLPLPPLADDEARDLWPVVARLLEKHPDDRFQTGSELLAALGVTTDASMHVAPTQRLRSSVAVPVATPPRRMGRKLSRAIRSPGAITLLVAGGALAAAMAFLPDGRSSLGGADCAPQAANGWSVRLLPLPDARPGDRLEMTWDVCGLPERSLTWTTVTLRPANARAAGRSVRPMRTVYRDTIVGRATRRQRFVRLDGVTPGSYVMSVGVRPDGGRERTASAPLRVDWLKR